MERNGTDKDRKIITYSGYKSTLLILTIAFCNPKTQNKANYLEFVGITGRLVSNRKAQKVSTGQG